MSRKLDKGSICRDQSGAHTGLITRDGTMASRTFSFVRYSDTQDYRMLPFCGSIVEILGIAPSCFMKSDPFRVVCRMACLNPEAKFERRAFESCIYVVRCVLGVLSASSGTIRKTMHGLVISMDICRHVVCTVTIVVPILAYEPASELCSKTEAKPFPSLSPPLYAFLIACLLLRLPAHAL